MNEEIDKIKKDIEYLFSKINWDTSFLDAKAIEIMNNLNRKLDLLKEVKFKDGSIL